MEDLVAGTPLAAIVGFVTWLATYLQQKTQAKNSRTDKLNEHRDGLVLDLIKNSRDEMQALRTEAELVKAEVAKLRPLEQHYFHFMQSLDHLEAILLAETDGQRKVAEHNARAFLGRVRKNAVPDFVQ